MSDQPSDDSLRKQYEYVLQEYRFQVQLNWDRAKHYLTFNTTVLGGAIALSKSADSCAAKLGVFALLLVAALNSFAGSNATRVGHEYYQRIRATKSQLERKLGLGSHAIQSTPGMRRDHDDLPEGVPAASSRRFSSIVLQTRLLLTILMLLSAAGALIALVGAWRACPWHE